MNWLEAVINQIRMLPKHLFLFIVGGLAYNLVEIMFRGYTHPTMFLLGGLCFILIGMINEKYPWEMPLVSQMFISMIIITILEFIFGVVLNIIFKLGVWNYSDLPYNLCGQICLVFSVAWFFLSVVAIIVDDYLRYLIYREEKPRYHIFYCPPKRSRVQRE